MFIKDVAVPLQEVELVGTSSSNSNEHSFDAKSLNLGLSPAAFICSSGQQTYSKILPILSSWLRSSLAYEKWNRVHSHHDRQE